MGQLFNKYDYYPFGMLMPDRYVSDTSSKCMTITQTKWVTTWVDSCYDVFKWVWPFTNLIAATATANTDGLIKYMDFNAPRAGASVSFGFNVTPGVGQSITFNVVALTSGTANVQIGETINGNWTVLKSDLLDRTGNITIHFIPSGGLVEARLLGPFRVRIGTVCVQKPVQTQETFLVDVCSDVTDRYRFGFNGQEKVNEWAGIGNFLDFAFRGYDSRIGRFLSIDPAMKKFPSWSPYVFAFDNPIRFNDPKGDAPPTLAEIIAAGKKSTTFSKLIKDNGITDNNCNNIITSVKPVSEGGRSFMNPDDNNNISLGTRDLGASILSLTHELTNRENADEAKNVQQLTREGKLTPRQYSDRILRIEAEGVFNKVKVAVELGLNDEKLQPYIDLLREEAAYPSQVFNLILSSSSNAIQKDNGKSAQENYMSQAEKMRANYLKEHPEAEKGTNTDEKNKTDENKTQHGQSAPTTTGG